MATNNKDEIIYQSDDLIKFGDFTGEEFGSYQILVYRDDPDDDGVREICSQIQSFDDDGNDDGSWIEDLPVYVDTARDVWQGMED